MALNIIFVVSKGRGIVFVLRIISYCLSYSIGNFTLVCYYIIGDL